MPPMRGTNTLKTAFALGVILSAAAPAWADATVYVRMNGFSPSSVTIGVGETVYFIVADDWGPYCIQSEAGAWTPWYLWDYGDGFGITINERGDYWYRDTFTYNRGVIHVGTPNVPPSVSITSPGEGAVLSGPASFTFEANASDPDDGVMRVDFYVGSNLVAQVTSAPFSTLVSGLVAGDYTLTAVAYDTALATATDSVHIIVQSGTPPTIRLGPPRIVGAQFQFEASDLVVGKQVILEASATPQNSGTWTPLQTNTVTSANFLFSTPVGAGIRFYRVLQHP